MIDPALLKYRVAFDPPVESDDGLGNVTVTYNQAAAYNTKAHFRTMRSGEAVIQSRLAGRDVMIVTIRANATTRAITQEWRMRDRDTGFIYNIKGKPKRDDRHWLEFLVEGGEVA